MSILSRKARACGAAVLCVAGYGAVFYVLAWSAFDPAGLHVFMRGLLA